MLYITLIFVLILAKTDLFIKKIVANRIWLNLLVLKI